MRLALALQDGCAAAAVGDDVRLVYLRACPPLRHARREQTDRPGAATATAKDVATRR